MDKTMEIRFNLYDGSKSGLTTLKMYDAWALQDIKRAEAAIAEAKSTGWSLQREPPPSHHKRPTQG